MTRLVPILSPLSSVIFITGIVDLSRLRPLMRPTFLDFKISPNPRVMIETCV